MKVIPKTENLCFTYIIFGREEREREILTLLALRELKTVMKKRRENSKSFKK